MKRKSQQQQKKHFQNEHQNIHFAFPHIAFNFKHKHHKTYQRKKKQINSFNFEQNGGMSNPYLVALETGTRLS